MKVRIPGIALNQTGEPDALNDRSSQPIMELRETFDSERYHEWKDWLRYKRKAPKRPSSGA